MKRLILSLAAVMTAFAVHLSAQEGAVYKASLFGCISDGITLNTNSIQTAVNTIHEKGGGSLHFYVGRYLTGTIHLKSNVTIVLHEGATLVGAPSIYDYDSPGNGAPRGLIIAGGQHSIGVIGDLPETPSIPPAQKPEIKGMGIIQGWGAKLLKVMNDQQQKGYLEQGTAPALISFVDCDNVRVEGLMLLEAAGDVQSYRNCRNVSVINQLVESKDTPASNGVTFGNCDGISLTGNFFEVTGKPIRTEGRIKGLKTSQNKTKSGTVR
ncbi:MAG: hypothetical protein LBD27_07180 [Tannerella sp.]|jgi:polygalacturonase|nr:hypothetical protein [Tannerella sp.]